MAQEFDGSNIPQVLKNTPNWVAYGPDPDTGKAKCPLIITAKDRRASTRKPETWNPWIRAEAFAKKHAGEEGVGIGFVITATTKLIYLDIDDCLDEKGACRKWAWPYVEPFYGKAYMERSPSGKGLHIIGRGTLPAPGGKANFPDVATGERVPEVAMFSDGKYTTITGDVWKGSGALQDVTEQAGLVWVAAGISATGPGTQAVGQAPRDADLPEVDPRKLPRRVAKEFRECLAATAPDRSVARFAVYRDLVERFTPEVAFAYILNAEVWYVDSGAAEKGREATWLDINRVSQKVITAKKEFEEFKEADEEGTKEVVTSWKELGIAVNARMTKEGPVHDAVWGVFNIVRVLAGHPEWKGRLRLNTFKDVVELDGQKLEGHGLPMIAEKVRKFLKWDREPMLDMVWKGLEEAARLRAYNPIQEHLKSLTWDNKRRIHGWLVRAGCEDTPLTRMIGKKWLISLIARAMDPGCQVDTVLVLEGAQGEKKSSMLRALAGGREYFTDAHVGMDKDGMMVVHGAWIVELAELASMKRAESSTVKAFISRREDTYRPPYGRTVKSEARHFLLTGSTNDDEYLTDPSGARRFWPVRVTSRMDVAWVEQRRDQLLAEALVLYQSGEPWWFDEEPVELQEAQNVRFIEDVLQDKVDAFIAEREKEHAGAFTIGQIVERIGVNLERGTAMRVADILKRRGLRKQRVSENGQRVVRWMKPGWLFIISENDLADLDGASGDQPESVRSHTSATPSKD